MTDLSTAERLEIERECEKLVRRHALYIDQSDYELIGDLYVEAGSFARPTDPENPITGRDNIVAGFKKRPPERMTRHIVSNCVIMVDDADSAHGISYITLYQAPAVDEGEGASKSDKPILVGNFEDRFVREDGVWKFVQRFGAVDITFG